MPVFRKESYDRHAITKNTSLLRTVRLLRLGSTAYGGKGDFRTNVSDRVKIRRRPRYTGSAEFFKLIFLR